MSDDEMSLLFRACRDGDPMLELLTSGLPTDLQERMETRLAKISAAGLNYLAEICDNDKQDVIDWWGGQEFDLGIPEHLGNCMFCIKKSRPKVALAARDEPTYADQFWHAITSPTVRSVETRKGQELVMYRDRLRFDQIIELWSGVPTDELKSRMTSQHRYDSGSCTESCEAFADLPDDFEDLI